MSTQPESSFHKRVSGFTPSGQVPNCSASRERSSAVNARCSLLLLLSAGLVAAGCAPEVGAPVLFVVPRGLHGAVQIIETNTAPSVLLEDGRYVYRFPTNGPLFVKEVAGFRSYHAVEAMTDDGRALPVLIRSDPERSMGGTALFEIDSYPGHYSFFIGSRSEMREYMKNRPQETEAARFAAGQWSNIPPELRGLRRR